MKKIKLSKSNYQYITYLDKKINHSLQPLYIIKLKHNSLLKYRINISCENFL